MNSQPKRGRPPLDKGLTIEQRIAALVACGYSPEEIACAIEMTVAELKRTYYALLADGARIARAEVIAASRRANREEIRRGMAWLDRIAGSNSAVAAVANRQRP